MLIFLWQIIITAFGNTVEDLSLISGFPFHRCRQQKKKNPFRTYVNILSKYCSPAFKRLSNLQTVAAAANALENCLSLFSSICNEIKLNDRDTILPWGWQEANSFLVFIFAPRHAGRKDPPPEKDFPHKSVQPGENTTLVSWTTTTGKRAIVCF